MRGLTKHERALLEDAATPADPEGDEATPDQAARYDLMVEQGRVVVRHLDNGEWEWEDWHATQAGLMALRVCPVEP